MIHRSARNAACRWPATPFLGRPFPMTGMQHKHVFYTSLPATFSAVSQHLHHPMVRFQSTTPIAASLNKEAPSAQLDKEEGKSADIQQEFKSSSHKETPPPIEGSQLKAEEKSTAEGEEPKSAFQRIKAALHGMSLKELVKQYGIPLAVFYWVTNESLVALLTYLFHYNYLTTGDVVDWLQSLGLGGYVNLETLHTASITVFGVEISALLLTNFLVASAVMSLFTPIQVPICVAVFPSLRRGVRKVLGRKP